MHGARIPRGGAEASRRRPVRRMRDAAVAVPMPATVPGARAERPPSTLQRGVLRIGTYFVNPPFEFVSDGNQTGFEFELMHEIARRLGVRAQFVDTRWETILR